MCKLLQSLMTGNVFMLFSSEETTSQNSALCSFSCRDNEMEQNM